MHEPREVIHTDQAPQAIGPYSQAIKVGSTAYISGQIPLDPRTGELVGDDFADQTRRVFDNLQAVARACGGDLKDIVKLNIFVTDLGHFEVLNTLMAAYFQAPFPARAAIEVAGLPKGSQVEMDAVLVVS